MSLVLQTKLITIVPVASDLRNYEYQPTITQAVTPPPQLPARKCTAIDPDLATLVFSFGQYLNILPGAKGIQYASEVVYQVNIFPMSLEF